MQLELIEQLKTDKEQSKMQSDRMLDVIQKVCILTKAI